MKRNWKRAINKASHFRNNEGTDRHIRTDWLAGLVYSCQVREVANKTKKLIIINTDSGTLNVDGGAGLKELFASISINIRIFNVLPLLSFLPHFFFIL